MFAHNMGLSAKLVSNLAFRTAYTGHHCLRIPISLSKSRKEKENIVSEDVSFVF